MKNISQGEFIQYGFFITLLIATIVVSFFIFQPYLFSILFALILAVAIEPIFNALSKLLRGHKRISAFLSILLVLCIIIIPLSFFGYQIFQEAQGAYSALSANSSSISVEKIGSILPQSLQKFKEPLSQDINTYIEQTLSFFVKSIGTIFSSIVSVFISFLITLFATFFILIYKKELRHFIAVMSPLPDEYDSVIIQKVRSSINSVVRGSLTIAVLQGIVTSIGFSIFGMPMPMLLGALAMFASFIPGLGTSIITAPCIIFLFITGNIPGGIGLTIWSILAVGIIDDTLAPLLYNKGIKLHPFIVFLSVLGGLIFFGPLGFILGPVTIALLATLLSLYPQILPSKN